MTAFELPMTYDASTKKISFDPAQQYEDDDEEFLDRVKLEIKQLNVLVDDIVSHGSLPTPPTPDTTNKQLTTLIKKMYDGGVKSFKAEKYPDAVKQFSLGIEMVSRRAKFESFQQTLPELNLFLMSRTDSYLKTKEYLKAFNDADLLLSIVPNVPENYLRKGVACYFLGNYEASKAEYERGLAFDPKNVRLQNELKVVIEHLKTENGEL
ncbi:hypothetical protein BABINDRAFT_142116 [Babjeviella inositovora NRRL Y-12698]|uniref:Uncharacterized protein n=1 Tax=Babjeviella inositovora NRRL Y-12698 TaxID=984486 RepID=A0A1E3QQP2_9ASCO|nr:uncharacterized protein BABINDRAFT_142116 [Babjeviella inositovora NRRL Y-12698]ODQ79392.1 hypothetical protein BABINDRAFT_142116 [Babjeviella inositovora NRRL Y-12698]